jgi:hypothetical protein
MATKNKYIEIKELIMFKKLLCLSLLLALIVGCSESTSQNVTQTPADTPAAKQESPKPIPSAPPPTQSTPAKEDVQPAVANPSNSEPESVKPAPGMTLDKADVGSGDKGRGYGQGNIATPVATYFAARERIAFNITIPDYVRAYKFEHDLKGPKTSKEFLDYLKKERVELPTLPRGHTYVYDPKTEELLVERPQ